MIASSIRKYIKNAKFVNIYWVIQTECSTLHNYIPVTLWLDLFGSLLKAIGNI